MRAVGWSLLALLLLGALAVSFLLHPLLGLFVALLMAGALGWALSKKRKVDAVLNEVAEQTGLSVVKRRFAYNALGGRFQGYETEVRIVGRSDAGLGTQLTALSGEGAWSTLDIQNVTLIKMKHGLPLQKKAKLAARTVVTPTEIVMVLNHVPQSADEVLKALRQLVRRIGRLQAGA